MTYQNFPVIDPYVMYDVCTNYIFYIFFAIFILYLLFDCS